MADLVNIGPDGFPTGPQLQDADLTAMSDDDLRTLADAVGMELKTCELLLIDGEIEEEEVRWVYSDAERVRNEMIRRDIWGAG